MRLSFIAKAVLGASSIAFGSASCAGGGSSAGAVPGTASEPSQSAGIAMQRSTAATQVQTAPAAISPDLCPTARVYVANYLASDIEVYPSYWIGQPTPCARITHGTLGPSGISVDANGTLYVSDYSYDAVTVFPKGRLTPSLTIPTAGRPQYAYGAPDGTLYVPETYSNQVEVFAAGTTVPERTIPVPSPWDVTTDQANDLYVVSGNRIVKFAPGASTGTDLGLSVSIGGIAVTTNGSIVAGDASKPMLDIYPPGKTTPSRSFPTISTFQFALNGIETHVFIASSDYNRNGQGVAEYDFKTGTLIDQFSAGTAEPDGIAYYPPAP